MTCSNGSCLRGFFIFVNEIFMILGIGLLILGVVFRYNNDLTEDKFKPIVEDIKVGDNYNLYQMLVWLSLVFIIAGAVVILVSVVGLIGACCDSTCLLITYMILLGIIFVAPLAVVCIFFIAKDDFESGVKSGVKVLIDKANGDNNTDARNVIEFVFAAFECCKVDMSRLEPETTDCRTLPPIANVDCYDGVQAKFDEYSGVFIGFGIAIVVIEILCFVASACACMETRRSAKFQ